LEDQYFLPLSKDNKNWNSCEIIHQPDKPDDAELFKFKSFIKNHITNQGGVYAYINPKNELLYFGKSKNIRDRIFMHYREAYTRISGTNKSAAWCELFSRNTGELTLLWRIIDQDRLRIAIEEMVEVVVQSLFDKKYPRRKRVLINRII
jgi:hypothetical protein